MGTSARPPTPLASSGGLFQNAISFPAVANRNTLNPLSKTLTAQSQNTIILQSSHSLINVRKEGYRLIGNDVQWLGLVHQKYKTGY